MKRLMLGSVLSAGVKVIGAGLTFLMFMLLARVLGPTEYGLFASMFALGTVGSITVLFGQHTLSIKTLSALGDGPGAAPARRYAIRKSYLVALTGVSLFIAVLLGGGLVARALGMSVDMRYLLGACAFVLPLALAELVSHQYRAFGAILWALAPRELVWRSLIVLACLGAAGLPFLFGDALTVMIALSAALMGLVSLQFVAMLLQNRALLAGASAAGGPQALDWRTSGWMWLASLGTMGASLNLSVAALFLPPDQIGQYFAAQKTSQLLQLPLIAIDLAATPVFARLYAQNDIAALRAVGRKLALLLAPTLVLGALVIIGFAPQLLALFDPAFAAAALTLTLLAGSYLVIGLGGPTRQLMLMSDGERDVVRLTLVCEVLGLALVPLLAPAFGILGAALAVCVSRVLFTVLTVLWCRRRLGVDTSVLSLLPGGAR